MKVTSFIAFNIFLILQLVGRTQTKSNVKLKAIPIPSSFTINLDSAHWDASTQSLYYIDNNDIDARIFRYDNKKDETFSASVINATTSIKFILPIKGKINHFLIGTKNKAAVIKWNGKSEEAIIIRIAFEVDCTRRFQENSFSIAKADPKGRIYAGTRSLDSCIDYYKFLPTGVLYRYEKNKFVKRIHRKIYNSNGLTWNRKLNKMYFIDSCAHNIIEYDYNRENGGLCKLLIYF